jgi:uncharacterized protein YjiS (DUF1127 family)
MSVFLETNHGPEGSGLRPHMPRRASSFRKMRTSLAWSLRMRRRRRERMASIAALLQLDDHTLRDIGLRRDDFVGR